MSKYVKVEEVQYPGESWLINIKAIEAIFPPMRLIVTSGGMRLGLTEKSFNRVLSAIELGDKQIDAYQEGVQEEKARADAIGEIAKEMLPFVMRCPSGAPQGDGIVRMSTDRAQEYLKEKLQAQGIEVE